MQRKAKAKAQSCSIAPQAGLAEGSEGRSSGRAPSRESPKQSPCLAPASEDSKKEKQGIVLNSMGLGAGHHAEPVPGACAVHWQPRAAATQICGLLNKLDKFVFLQR